MNKIFILILTLFFMGNNIYSQKFTATTNKNPVASGDAIQVTFSCDVDCSDFRPPDFKGFSVLGGPNQSQSMSIMNGQMTRSISYSYVLRAGDPGTYTIKPASVNAGGKRISSNAINITVVKGSAQQQGKNTEQKTESSQADEIIRKNFYVTLAVNKTSVYQGEAVIATYKIYKHPDLALIDLKMPKTPAFNGFWSQDMESITQLKWGTEVVNGIRFQTSTLKKVLLIPQQTGQLTIDPLELETVAQLRVQGNRRRSNDPFEDFFNDPFFNNNVKNFPYTAKSKTAILAVKPLPGNAPADFKGGVGDMRIKAWLNKNDAKTNEPLTLKIQVSGTGNLRLIEPFNLNLPPDFESYEPKIADNLALSPSGFNGNKTFEYIIIPRHAGKFEINPINFVYFDLNKKSYVSLSTDKFVINVEQGTASEATSIISGVTKEDIKYLGKDIRFIKNSNFDLSKSPTRFFGTIPFMLLDISPLILFIGFIFYRKRYEKLHQDQMLLKTRRANKLAKKRLSAAKKYLELKDSEKFYEELTRGLWGYISDKLGIPFSDLTKDSTADSLRMKNIPEDNITNFLSTIDDCEFARYAPSAGSGEMEHIYNDAVKVITELEGRLK